MADIGFIQTTLSIVDKYLEARREKRRVYLGMSEAGHKCSRYLWIKYHTNYQQNHTARIKRIFELGNLIEKRIIKELKSSGFIIKSKQGKFDDFNGKFKGHCDGVIYGLVESSMEHILEIKSCNDKNFKLFLKHGIRNHPVYGEKYYAQVQLYMGYSGLKRAMFIVENKNDSKQYQERIKFNKEDFEKFRLKAESIIFSKFPPKGISNRIDWWECKMCPFNNESDCRRLWKGENAF
jgi:hypothetical protein